MSEWIDHNNLEDDIMYLKCQCGEYKHILFDEVHMYQCDGKNNLQNQQTNQKEQNE